MGPETGRHTLRPEQEAHRDTLSTEKLSNPRREQTVGSGRRLRIRSIRNDAVTIAHRREKFDRRPSDPPTIRGPGIRHHPA